MAPRRIATCHCGMHYFLSSGKPSCEKTKERHCLKIHPEPEPRAVDFIMCEDCQRRDKFEAKHEFGYVIPGVGGPESRRERSLNNPASMPSQEEPYARHAIRHWQHDQDIHRNQEPTREMSRTTMENARRSGEWLLTQPANLDMHYMPPPNVQLRSYDRLGRDPHSRTDSDTFYAQQAREANETQEAEMAAARSARHSTHRSSGHGSHSSHSSHSHHSHHGRHSHHHTSSRHRSPSREHDNTAMRRLAAANLMNRDSHGHDRSYDDGGHGTSSPSRRQAQSSAYLETNYYAPSGDNNAYDYDDGSSSSHRQSTATHHASAYSDNYDDFDDANIYNYEEEQGGEGSSSRHHHASSSSSSRRRHRH